MGKLPFYDEILKRNYRKMTIKWSFPIISLLMYLPSCQEFLKKELLENDHCMMEFYKGIKGYDHFPINPL